MGGRAADIDKRLTNALEALPAAMSAKLAVTAGAFAPADQLVRDALPDRKHSCRINRASLAPIWSWIATDVAPDAANSVVRTWIASQLDVGGADRQKALSHFHRVAGDKLRERLATASEDARSEIGARLGSDAALSDAEDLAELLAERAPIAELFGGWPDRSEAVDPHLLKSLKRFCDDHIRRSPRLVALVAALAAERMAHPAAVAGLLGELVKRRNAKSLDQSPFAPVIAGLIEDVEESWPDREPTLADFEQVHTELAEIAAAFNGLVNGPAIEWISVQRARLRDRLEVAIAQAGEAALKMFTWLEEHPVRLPEISPEDLQAVEVGAAFVKQAENIASAVGAQIVWGNANRKIDGMVQTSLVNEWLTKVAAQQARERARTLAHLRAALAITRGFRGEAAATLLERQIQSAIGRPDAQSLVLQLVDPMTDWGEEAKTPGRVAASSLDAFWAWARDDIASDAVEAAEADLEAARTPAQRDEFVANIPGLRSTIGRSALEALSRLNETGMPESWSERTHADITEIAYVLLAGSAIAREMGDWPVRIRDLNDPMLTAFRTVFDQLTANTPEAGPAFLLYLLSRLEKPAQLLRALARCTRHESDVAIEVTDYSIVGVVILDRATECAKSFDISQREAFEAPKVLAHLEEYAGIVSGMTEEFVIRADGRWGRQLYALRSRAARCLEQICEQASKHLEEVTPRTRASRKGGDQANIDVPVNEERWARAAAFVRFIDGARIWDTRAGFAAAREKASDAIRRRLDTQIESLVTLAHSDDADVAERALPHLRALEPLVRGFEGDEAADLILRRVAAAA